jgi:hypothetical protein
VKIRYTTASTAGSRSALRLAGHPVRDPGVPDLGLCPHQPLGHRRLGHQEGRGDLGSGQAAQQSQGQRHLRRDGERRVAAREHHAQPVVGHGSLLHRFGVGMQQRGLRVAVGPGDFPAQPVDGPVPGGGDDPAGRAGRDALGRPALDGGEEGILHRLLGGADVAEEAGEHGDGPAVLLAEDALDLHGRHLGHAVGQAPEPS